MSWPLNPKEGKQQKYCQQSSNLQSIDLTMRMMYMQITSCCLLAGTKKSVEGTAASVAVQLLFIIFAFYTGQ